MGSASCKFGAQIWLVGHDGILYTCRQSENSRGGFRLNPSVSRDLWGRRKAKVFRPAQHSRFHTVQSVPWYIDCSNRSTYHGQVIRVRSVMKPDSPFTNE